MQYAVQHIYVETTELVTVKKNQNNNIYSITYFLQGDIPVRHPGQLNVLASAYCYLHLLSGSPGRGGHPVTQQIYLPVSAKVFSPDGQAFPVHHVIEGFAADITLDDL